MSFTYINRKGFTYFLNKGLTKTGKPRYYFTREQKDEVVEQIPPGYQIEESVNGIVSLAKVRPQLIQPDESASVEAALKRHPKARKYRLAVKNNQIIVYEATGADDERFQATFDHHTQFTPVMRFILDDQETREYHAERWCYLGSVDDWIHAGHSGKIGRLAKELIPTLGTDEFYELY